MSSHQFLSIQQIAEAAHLAGKDYTIAEIAEHIGRSARSVRVSLGVAGIKLSPKPYGHRQVSALLSPAQVEGLREVADRHGYVGADRHAKVLEKAGRRLGAEPDLLASLVDPTLKPIFFSADLFEGLQGEARKYGITPQELAGRILSTVVQDQIVGAVLDTPVDA